MNLKDLANNLLEEASNGDLCEIVQEIDAGELVNLALENDLLDPKDIIRHLDNNLSSIVDEIERLESRLRSLSNKNAAAKQLVETWIEITAIPTDGIPTLNIELKSLNKLLEQLK